MKLRGKTSYQNLISEKVYLRHQKAMNELRASYSENESLLFELETAAKELLALANPAGIASYAEDMVAEWVKGTGATNFKDGYDVISHNGKKIEVKISKLNIPGKNSTTKRWSFSNVLGGDILKSCDYVLLLGEIDERFREHYKTPDGNFVALCIPHITTNTNQNGLLYAGMRGQMHITTNPLHPTTTAILNSYSMSKEELEMLFVCQQSINWPITPMPTDLKRARGGNYLARNTEVR